MSKLNLGKDLYIKGRIGWRGLNKSEYLNKSDYRIINATALMDGYIDWDNCGYISKERFEESSEIILQENDILISKDGTIGKIGYVKNLPFACTVASGIFVVRNTKKQIVNFDYLYHLLKSSIFKDFIKRNKADGSTINHLYQRDLEKFEIELPELEVQNKISYILNLIDKQMYINNHINIKVEKYLSSLYSYLFLQFATSKNSKMFFDKKLKRNIPQNFDIKQISDFCEIFTGKKDVNQALDFGKYKFYSCSPDYKYSNEYLYKGKAILVSGNGSYTGRTIYIEDAFDLYQRTYAIVPKDDNDILEFIYYVLKFQFTPRAGGGTHGSAIPYIVYDDIAKEKFPYNKEIVGEFLKIAKPLHKLMVKNYNTNINIAKYKEIILPMLMNGQLKIN